MFIVYEDEDLIVCFKEAGLAVQSAGLRSRDLQSLLLCYLRETRECPGTPYLGVVHRLDQPVQGLVVFALTERAARDLSLQSREGRMRKEYLALVCANDEGAAVGCGGAGESAEITLTDFLVKDARTKQACVVDRRTSGAKRAVLRFSDVTRAPEFSPVMDSLVCDKRTFDGNAKGELRLLKVLLETGRYHQIRAQLAHAQMPIIGDKRYGSGETSEMLRFPALCACRLSFLHPVTGRKMCFELEAEKIIFS